MTRLAPLIAALLGLTGVAFGAFGAHGLASMVSLERLTVWETAVSYQMYHTPVILLLGLLPALGSRPLASAASTCFILGVLVFSGSLYALVWFDLPRLGMVTPIGGVLLLLGWLLLLVALIRRS